MEGMELWGLDSEEDLAFWKRMLFMAIGVVVAAGILVILYFLYETYALGKKGAAPASDQPQASAEQQRIIKSLTAPAQESAPSGAAQASDPSAATPSGAQAHNTATEAPKPPSELTAPAPSSKTTAQPQEDQAAIDSLTAPH